ncbi:hypothetical protein E2C01_036641 [Portunus trituberculatus]|uniref:Uncharacterized protein n=1 Tax=Portunus trituberculatus TaxID=210409 RepID=A0A5B7FCI1_PORTR|nr:hypothetical protein [Portunus trituberculatus]
MVEMGLMIQDLSHQFFSNYEGFICSIEYVLGLLSSVMLPDLFMWYDLRIQDLSYTGSFLIIFLSSSIEYINPFSTRTRFHIHSAYCLVISYSFRNSCGVGLK